MFKVDLLHDKELKEQLKKFGIGILPQIRFGLEQYLDKAANVARTIVPVKTGRLQSSLSYQITSETGSSIEGRVGSNVDYAKFVELGTHRMRARPYLLPAVEQTIGELVDFIKKALK